LRAFADQLGPHVESTDGHRDRGVVLVESNRALRRKPFHPQKPYLVLSGMRHPADELGDRATPPARRMRALPRR
jgi:deoxyribodipyrimidine photolyase-related protein